MPLYICSWKGFSNGQESEGQDQEVLAGSQPLTEIKTIFHFSVFHVNQRHYLP